VAGEALKALTRERAEAIRREIMAKGELDMERVTILDPSAAEEKGKETVSSALKPDVRR
jgi:hypothetical protein